LLVPVSVPAVRFAAIEKVPTFENVTLYGFSTPFVKAAVVPLPDASVPVDVISTVSPKLVTMLFKLSTAVICMNSGTPAL
jgi:hypothetical protein